MLKLISSSTDGKHIRWRTSPRGSTLGYLDLRHGEIGWRERFPDLSRLAERLVKRASFADSTP